MSPGNRITFEVEAMKTIAAMLLVSVAMVSVAVLLALPISTGVSIDASSGPVPGWKYQAAYRFSDGKIVALFGGPSDSTAVPILNEGDAILDITGYAELSGLLRDARNGSLDRWYVDTTTLELRHKAPGPLPVIGTLPASILLVLTVSGASIGLLGLAMVRRRSSL